MAQFHEAIFQVKKALQDIKYGNCALVVNLGYKKEPGKIRALLKDQVLQILRNYR